MKYLGMDVHGKATVYWVLDAQGQVIERGEIATTAPALTELMHRLLSTDALVCGQEVGTMSHFVHDVVTSAGAKILSFNAQHIRMIATSRKKTDKRDAYWIAKCLQTGMMPHRSIWLVTLLARFAQHVLPPHSPSEASFELPLIGQRKFPRRPQNG
jgi:transposase